MRFTREKYNIRTRVNKVLHHNSYSISWIVYVLIFHCLHQKNVYLDTCLVVICKLCKINDRTKRRYVINDANLIFFMIFNLSFMNA